LITEPGAMTICALLLGKQFYRLKPSLKLSYATLGLLFVNISVGGIFTNFAAPPVLMVSKAWHWDSAYMMSHFGWKAVIGILLANTLYFNVFRKELRELDKKRDYADAAAADDDKEGSIPFWISLVHLFFLAWTVVHSHYPVIFIGTFLLFLGFYRATLPYQTHLNLKTPLLVGFFLAGLVVHGGLQAWWISPILSNVSNWMLMVMSVVLTAFNDNAEITYLATLVPTFDEAMKYAVVAGAVTGGGLTVIANAPNPAGQAILSRHFPDGVAPLYLFLAALLPTIIIGICLYFIPVF
jgi:Na+/H+ antiporter NhaD/arsenite permease-like protein